jgi:hypothetical protein
MPASSELALLAFRLKPTMVLPSSIWMTLPPVLSRVGSVP